MCSIGGQSPSQMCRDWALDIPMGTGRAVVQNFPHGHGEEAEVKPA